MNDAATIICILAACVAFATVAAYYIRRAWNALWAYISRRITTYIDNALGPETNEQRYAELEREHQALLLAEHNRDDS